MSSSRLDLSERYRLHALHETGMSMRAIADALERARVCQANCVTRFFIAHSSARVLRRTSPGSFA
ncbi:helix-turn-helix domain-containing protein, partial [Xanthomonas oryzae]|uniref:helix-turn-helix domain-containing protein n=2 Tax=Xanthomonas oryzae TaxID=347 RepID=UPI0021167ADD